MAKPEIAKSAATRRAERIRKRTADATAKADKVAEAAKRKAKRAEQEEFRKRQRDVARARNKTPWFSPERRALTKEYNELGAEARRKKRS